MADPTDDDDAPPPLGRRVLLVARELLLLLVVAVPLMMVVGWLRAPDLPDQAPAFTLRDVDGRSVTLSDYAGQTVVLNFWATWCGPCRAEAPSFAAYARAHPDVVLLGLVADGPPSKARAVANDLGITYRVVMSDDATEQAYGVRAYPTTVIVAPDGSVRWVHTGVMFRPQLAWLTGHLW